MKTLAVALLLAAPAAAQPPVFLRFDPAMDMPYFGFHARGASAHYLILGDGWARFAYLEGGAAHLPLELKPPEIMLLGERIIVRWPLRMLPNTQSGRETLVLDWPSGKAGLTRQLYDKDAFLSGWGSLDDLPLKKPVHREVRLVREEDEAALEALRRLTPQSTTVIN